MADFIDTKQDPPTDNVQGTDCIFLVGPDKVRISANSTLLSAVSKPFRTMFGPNWKEGNDLKTTTTSTPEFPLPEDDATALQILCAVIHYRSDEVPENVPARSSADGPQHRHAGR
ncbi:hypothetical protein NX059_007098 [Plenodomus lindquistii]|nr:hypothetical protein NX059_007098 [Plenodomus lindquistii]